MLLRGVISKPKQPNYGVVNILLLILSGVDDKTAPLSGSEAICNAYGSNKDMKWIGILADVGHWYCVEAPEEVARLVLQFVQVLV